MGTASSSRLLLYLVGLLGLCFLVLLPFLRTETREPDPTRPGLAPLTSPRASPRATTVSGTEMELPAVSDTRPLEPRAEAQVGGSQLLVLRRTDRAPIAGISVHAQGVRLGGPSDEAGLIEFERQGTQPLVVWGEGWIPVFVRAFEGTPESVLMDEASARLEVRVLRMGPDDVVVKSLLQPRAFQVVGDSPWNPVLESSARDRLAGERIPAGYYDVYVWVARGSDAPRCLESPGVHLEGAELRVLELDAGAPPEPDPDG